MQHTGGCMFIQSKSDTFQRKFLAQAGILSVILGTALLLPAPAAIAQDGSNQALDEITVTSRRYEESIEDAPVAVNVMTEDYMKNNRITRADDLMEVTPGATWESFSKMQPVASMRGVIAPTPGNASSEASIQTVSDNVVITKDSMKYPTIFDMARVEVMRGPQGTAFGRNASVGLIHFVSNRPSQSETGGSVTGTFGTDELIELEGFYTGQFSDTISARIAFNSDSQDGPTKSATTGEGLDGDSNNAVRASLFFEPSDVFSAYFKLEYSADRDDAPVRSAYYQPGSGLEYSVDPFVGGRDTLEGPYPVTWYRPDDPFLNEISSGYDFSTERDILTAAAELVWEFEAATLTSITGYLNGDTHSLMDLVGTPNNVSFQEVANDAKSFSTELRVDNVSSGNKVTWLAGLYVMNDEEDRFEQNIFQADGSRLGPWVETHMGTVANNRTSSFSVFGEMNFDIGDKATLTYGGRFVSDEKDYLYGVRAWGTNKQLGGVPGVGPDNGAPEVCPFNGPPRGDCGSADAPLGFEDHPVNDSWSDYISKLSLSYAINDSMNIYGLYSEGFKSGTFQPDARNTASADIVVEPETSTNFEIGLKGSGERYRYAITTYFMEINDVQTINLVPVGAGFTGLISNVGKVESKGLELEGTFLLTDNFLISGTVGIIDAEMKDTPDPTGAIDPDTGEVYSLDGHRPAGAPEYTFTFYGEYTVNMGNGSSLLFRADVRSRSDVFNQTSNRFTDPPLRLRPEVTNFGARVSWISADDNLAISVWGKNLGEEVDIENFGPPSPCCSSFAAGFRGKRYYGVTASLGFGG
jgi:iron complex outermembrane receptor protein